jgi:hypothetical protein
VQLDGIEQHTGKYCRSGISLTKKAKLKRKWHTFRSQIHHRVQFFHVLKKMNRTRDDGAFVLARVALLARNIYAAGMAKFVQHDAGVTFEWGLGI